MRLPALLLLLPLAGCGGSGGAGGADVLNACAAFDKGAIARSVGKAIASATPSAVHDGSEGGDPYSQCAYSFGGTEMIVIGTGQASGGESDADLAERLRSQMKMGSDAPTENVAGLGKAAMWNPGLNALYVFPGDSRFISLTMSLAGNGDQKAAAIALAHALKL